MPADTTIDQFVPFVPFARFTRAYTLSKAVVRHECAHCDRFSAETEKPGTWMVYAPVTLLFFGKLQKVCEKRLTKKG
jgi:hypothetical protein